MLEEQISSPMGLTLITIYGFAFPLTILCMCLNSTVVKNYYEKIYSKYAL